MSLSTLKTMPYLFLMHVHQATTTPESFGAIALS